jgi:hypothetical protein
MGASLSYADNYVAGKPHLEKAATILEGVHDDGLITRFKDDPLVIRYGFDAWVSGEPERSMALTKRAVTEVEPGGHASTLCFRFSATSRQLILGGAAIVPAAHRSPEKPIDVVRLGGLDALAGRQRDLDRRADAPFAAGSKRRVAGFKSESRPASNRLRWPTSSESADSRRVVLEMTPREDKTGVKIKIIYQLLDCALKKIWFMREPSRPEPDGFANYEFGSCQKLKQEACALGGKT